MATTIELPLACPGCLASLEVGTDAAVCGGGHRFVVEDRVVNFLDALKPDVHERPLDHGCEASGIEHRTKSYLLPWLRREFGEDVSSVRLLEDGAGGGAQVQEFVRAGVDAYGVDPGHRSEQWRDLDALAGRMFIADGCQLPFPDATFDVVTSSGVLEHVGEPRPLPQRDPYQARYMCEILRVLKPGGVALIAHPNGANPVDFWHPLRTTARLHKPYEKWMPDIYQVRRWTATSPVPFELRFLSPNGYLAFERVRKYWYGRLFAGGMQTLFRAMDHVPFLARTWINPWLMTEVRRTT